MIQKTVAIYSEAFSGSSLQNDTLLVQVSQSSIVCLVYTQKQQVSALEVFDIEEQNGWQQVWQDVRDYSSLISKVYAQTYIYHHTARALLIPAQLYNQQAAVAFIAAVHVNDIGQQLSHTNIPGSNAVLAWEVNESLAAAIAKLLPDASVHHVYQTLLQQALAPQYDSHLLLHVYPQCISLVLVKKNTPQLLQTFETATAEDILYHTLAALKQHAVLPGSVQVTVAGHVNAYPQLQAYLQQSFPRLQWAGAGKQLNLIQNGIPQPAYHFSPYLHPLS
jgi:hypothetical protein